MKSNEFVSEGFWDSIKIGAARAGEALGSHVARNANYYSGVAKGLGAHDLEHSLGSQADAQFNKKRYEKAQQDAIDARAADTAAAQEKFNAMPPEQQAFERAYQQFASMAAQNKNNINQAVITRAVNNMTGVPANKKQAVASQYTSRLKRNGISVSAAAPQQPATNAQVSQAQPAISYSQPVPVVGSTSKFVKGPSGWVYDKNRNVPAPENYDKMLDQTLAVMAPAAPQPPTQGVSEMNESVKKAQKLINEYTVKEMAVRRLKKELNEAKKLVKQEFRQVSYEEFERLGSSSSYYEETQIDGKWVIALYNGADCVGLYYTRAKVGSYCPTFKGDEISFSEQDPNWPYGD